MSNSSEIRLLTTKWLTFSALGLVLLAAGIVTLSESIVMRVSGKDIFSWGWVLTVAVIIVSAGISFLGTSIKYRIYLDRKRKQDSEFNTRGGSSRSHRHKH